MGIKHESRVEVTCKAEPSDIDLTCSELVTHGAAGAKAIEILKELGSVVSKVTQATGTIRLIVSAAQGALTSRMDLNFSAEGAALPSGADAWDIPLEKVNLSGRARTAVEQAELKTLGDLASTTEDALREKTRGAGAQTFTEIRTTLMAYGLEFGMTGKPVATVPA